MAPVVTLLMAEVGAGQVQQGREAQQLYSEVPVVQEHLLAVAMERTAFHQREPVFQGIPQEGVDPEPILRVTGIIAVAADEALWQPEALVTLTV